MSKFSQPMVLMAICLSLLGILALPGFSSDKQDIKSVYARVSMANNVLISTGQITFTPVATAFLPVVIKPADPPSTPPATNTATATGTPTATATPTDTRTPTATATDKPFEDVVIVRIEYDPPGLDSEGEYVDLKSNELHAVNMNNWTLRDESDTVFSFPDFTLGALSTVRVWIRSGANDSNNLYWGRNSATWNNDGDTAILRNSDGTEIDRCTYSGGGQTAIC